MMLREILGRGILGRVLSYALFVLGFWLLFQAFERPSPGLGVLGGALILLAMYAMVGGRKGFGRFRSGPPDGDTEDTSTDCGDASDNSPPDQLRQ